MPEFDESAIGRVAAQPDEVFDLITDIDRLPDWNACIEKVPASLQAVAAAFAPVTNSQ